MQDLEFRRGLLGRPHLRKSATGAIKSSQESACRTPSGCLSLVAWVSRTAAPPLLVSSLMHLAVFARNPSDSMKTYTARYVTMKD